MNPGHMIEWLLAFALTMAAVAVAVAVARWFWGAARQFRRIVDEEAPRPAVVDDALAIVCGPCNGKSGKCTCASKCRDWLCGADDTAIGEWTDAELAFLHGHRETPDE